jgi:spore maturation protein SpmA
MVLHYIFSGFFIVAFIVAILRLVLFNDTEVFSKMLESTFTMAETSVNISIYLIGVMSLWLGIMRIGEKGGAVQLLSKAVAPLFSKLFPEVPSNHPATASMLMNFSANMLGLDNAATPLGLKAMTELQELNPVKDKASNAQIMFMVLNTSGLTIIPVSVMAIRAAQGAANPADIFLPILLATFFSSLAGLSITALYQKINLFSKTILLYLGSLSVLIAALIWFIIGLSQSQIGVYSSFGGSFLILSIIIFFLVLAIRKKENVYDSFIDGAKEGFQIAVKIIPYLVAILVAIGVFRASGSLDLLISGIEKCVALLGFNTDFVASLPTALMRPLSGSGARGLMIETMQTYGADSFQGKLACIFQGTTETTFYTLAVYFGSVAIKNTRHAVGCALFADLVGIIAAILLGYLFFY